MAQGDPIPDTDHVARYCRKETLNDEGFPDGTAFRLRPGKDRYVSVNWLEHFGTTDKNAQLASIRADMQIKPGAQAKLAVLNVRETRDYVKNKDLEHLSLCFLHEPEPDDLSHSGIHNLPLNDKDRQEILADLIAECARECYPAKG